MATRVSLRQPEGGLNHKKPNLFLPITTPSIPVKFTNSTVAKQSVRQFLGPSQMILAGHSEPETRKELSQKILAHFKPQPSDFAICYVNTVPDLVALLREVSGKDEQANARFLGSIFGSAAVSADLKALVFLHLVSTLSEVELLKMVNDFKDAKLTLPVIDTVFSKLSVGGQNGFQIFDHAQARLLNSPSVEARELSKELQKSVYQSAVVDALGKLYPADTRSVELKIVELLDNLPPVPPRPYRGSDVDQSLPVQALSQFFKSDAVTENRFADLATRTFDAVTRGQLHYSVLTAVVEKAMKLGNQKIAVKAALLFFDRCEVTSNKPSAIKAVFAQCTDINQTYFLQGLLRDNTVQGSSEAKSTFQRLSDDHASQLLAVSTSQFAQRTWQRPLADEDHTFGEYVQQLVKDSRDSEREWQRLSGAASEKVGKRKYSPTRLGVFPVRGDFSEKTEWADAVQQHICQPMKEFEKEFQTICSGVVNGSKLPDVGALDNLHQRLLQFKTDLRLNGDISDVVLADKRYIPEACTRLDQLCDGLDRLRTQLRLDDEVVSLAHVPSSFRQGLDGHFDRLILQSQGLSVSDVGVKSKKMPLRVVVETVETQYQNALKETKKQGDPAILRQFLSQTLSSASKQLDAKKSGRISGVAHGETAFIAQANKRFEQMKSEIHGLLDSMRTIYYGYQDQTRTNYLGLAPLVGRPFTVENARSDTKRQLAPLEITAFMADFVRGIDPANPKPLDESIAEMDRLTQALSGTLSAKDCEHLVGELNARHLRVLGGTVTEKHHAISVVVSRLANTFAQLFGATPTPQSISDVLGNVASPVAQAVQELVLQAATLLHHDELGMMSFRGQAASSRISADASRLSEYFSLIGRAVIDGRVTVPGLNMGQFNKLTDELAMHRTLASDFSQAFHAKPDEMLAKCHERVDGVKEKLAEMRAYIAVTNERGLPIPVLAAPHDAVGTDVWVESLRMVIRQYEDVLHHVEAVPDSKGMGHLNRDQLLRLEALDTRLTALVGVPTVVDNKPNITAYFNHINAVGAAGVTPAQQATDLAQATAILTQLEQRVVAATQTAQSFTVLREYQLRDLDRILSYEHVLKQLRRDITLAGQQAAAVHPVSMDALLDLVKTIDRVQKEMALLPAVGVLPPLQFDRTLSGDVVLGTFTDQSIPGTTLTVAQATAQIDTLKMLFGSDSPLVQQKSLAIVTVLLDAAQKAATASPAHQGVVDDFTAFIQGQLGTYLPLLSAEQQLELGRKVQISLGELRTDPVLTAHLAAPPPPPPAVPPGLEIKLPIYKLFEVVKGDILTPVQGSVHARLADQSLVKLADNIRLGRSTGSRAVSITERKALLESQMSEVVVALCQVHDQIAQLKGVFPDADVHPLQQLEVNLLKAVADKMMELISKYPELKQLPIFKETGFSDAQLIAQTLNRQLRTMFEPILAAGPALTLKSGRDAFAVALCQTAVSGFDATTPGAALSIAATGISVEELHVLAADIVPPAVATLSDAEKRMRLVEIFTPALGKAADSVEFTLLQTHLKQLTAVERQRILTLLTSIAPGLYEFSRVLIGRPMASLAVVSGEVLPTLKIILASIPGVKAIAKGTALTPAEFNRLSRREKELAHNPGGALVALLVGDILSQLNDLAGDCISRMAQAGQFQHYFNGLSDANKASVLLSLLEYDRAHGSDVTISALMEIPIANFDALVTSLGHLTAPGAPADHPRFAEMVTSAIKFLTGEFVDRFTGPGIAGFLPADNGQAAIVGLLQSHNFRTLLNPPGGPPAVSILTRDQVSDILLAISQRYSLEEVLRLAAPLPPAAPAAVPDLATLLNGHLTGAFVPPASPAPPAPGAPPIDLNLAFTAEVFNALIPRDRAAAVKGMKKLSEAPLTAVLKRLDNAALLPNGMTLRQQVMSELLNGRSLLRTDIDLFGEGNRQSPFTMANCLVREVVGGHFDSILSVQQSLTSQLHPIDYSLAYAAKNWMMQASNEDLTTLFSDPRVVSELVNRLNANAFSDLLRKPEVLDAFFEGMRKIQHQDFGQFQTLLTGANGVFSRLFSAAGRAPGFLVTTPGYTDSLDQLRTLLEIKVALESGDFEPFKQKFMAFPPQVLVGHVIPYLRSIRSGAPLVSLFDRAMGLLQAPTADLMFFSQLLTHVDKDLLTPVQDLNNALGFDCTQLMGGVPVVHPPSALLVAKAIAGLRDGSFTLSSLNSTNRYHKQLLTELLRVLTHYQTTCPPAQHSAWLTAVMSDKGAWLTAINTVFGGSAGLTTLINDPTVVLYRDSIAHALNTILVLGVVGGPNFVNDVLTRLKPLVGVAKLGGHLDGYRAELAKAKPKPLVLAARRTEVLADALEAFGINYAAPAAAPLQPATGPVLDQLRDPDRLFAIFSSVASDLNAQANAQNVFSQWIEVSQSAVAVFAFNPPPDPRAVGFVCDMVESVLDRVDRFKPEDCHAINSLIRAIPQGSKPSFFVELHTRGVLPQLMQKLFAASKLTAGNVLSSLKDIASTNPNIYSSLYADALAAIPPKAIDLSLEIRDFMTRMGVFAPPAPPVINDLGPIRVLLQSFDFEHNADFRNAFFETLQPDELHALLTRFRAGIEHPAANPADFARLDTFLTQAQNWMSDCLSKNDKRPVFREKCIRIFNQMMYLPSVAVADGHQPHQFNGWAGVFHLSFISRNGVDVTIMSRQRAEPTIMDYDRKQLKTFLFSLPDDQFKRLHDQFASFLIVKMGVSDYHAVLKARHVYDGSKPVDASKRAVEMTKKEAQHLIDDLWTEFKRSWEQTPPVINAQMCDIAFDLGLGRLFLLKLCREKLGAGPLGVGGRAAIEELMRFGNIGPVFDHFSQRDPIEFTRLLTTPPFVELLSRPVGGRGYAERLGAWLDLAPVVGRPTNRDILRGRFDDATALLQGVEAESFKPAQRRR